MTTGHRNAYGNEKTESQRKVTNFKKFSEKSLEMILTTECMSFWTQIEVNMTHFGAVAVFL